MTGDTRTEQPQTIQRLYKGETDDASKSKRTVTSIITTDAIDRYREVIVAKGISLENYRQNPIVLWCHCAGAPIAKNLWIKRFTKDGRSGLIAKTLFAKCDQADEIFQLYVEGILNAWSIGANPDWKSYGAPTEDEIKARPELKQCRAMYRKCELVEYSAVSIPANQEALGNEVGKSISADLRRQIESGGSWKDIVLEYLGKQAEPEPEPTKQTEPPPLVLPPLVGRTFEEALAQTKRAVAAMTGPEAAERAARDTIDRAMGRV